MRRFCLFFLLLTLMLTGCSETNDTRIPSGESISNASLVKGEENSADSSMSFSSVSSAVELESSVTEDLETSSLAQAELTQPERQQRIFDLADNETKCQKMITQKIDWENERDFRSFATRISRPIYGYIPTIDMIDSEYPIECLRDMGDGRRYAVYFLKGGGRFFFFFYNGSYYHSAYVSKAKYKKDFDDIVIGDSFEKVVAVDRDARVWEYEWSSGEYGYSAHLLKDGVLFYQYQDGIITDIDYSADFSFDSGEWEYDYSILPQDYPS